MSVGRFCRRLGIPTSTWYYWRQRARLGRPVKRWPAPVVDVVEVLAAQKKDDERFSPWGHRKIWKLIRTDGIVVSQSSVKRALARRGLLLPVRYQAGRRALARARKGTFRAPAVRRNRVWQTDFSEFETTRAGTWDISGVVDYVAKVCLTCPANATKTGPDAVNALEAAIEEAERLMGHSMQEDCIDPETGEIFPLVIVTDNGSAYKSDLFARFILSKPWLAHIRTRYRAPQTNGVIERFYGSLKYEHLYRYEIADGITLNDEAEGYRHTYNEVRPHEHLDFETPMSVYLAPPISFEVERRLLDEHRAALEAERQGQPSPE